MTNIDEIKSIIVKSLETANKDEIVNAYEILVSCGDCLFWHNCRNEHNCFEYIMNKMEGIE